MKDKKERSKFRKQRTLRKLRIGGGDRPRLAVRRSLKYIYAQVVDDNTGKTLAAASSLELDGDSKAVSRKNLEWAGKVGSLIAKKALAAGVKKIAFDRGDRIYHGRVKALAEAARAGGLEF